MLLCLVPMLGSRWRPPLFSQAVEMLPELVFNSSPMSFMLWTVLLFLLWCCYVCVPLHGSFILQGTLKAGMPVQGISFSNEFSVVLPLNLKVFHLKALLLFPSRLTVRSSVKQVPKMGRILWRQFCILLGRFLFVTPSKLLHVKVGSLKCHFISWKDSSTQCISV